MLICQFCEAEGVVIPDLGVMCGRCCDSFLREQDERRTDTIAEEMRDEDEARQRASAYAEWRADSSLRGEVEDI